MFRANHKVQPGSGWFVLNSPYCVLQLGDKRSVVLPLILPVDLGWEEVNYLRLTMNYLNYYIHRRHVTALLRGLYMYLYMCIFVNMLKTEKEREREF